MSSITAFVDIEILVLYIIYKAERISAQGDSTIRYRVPGNVSSACMRLELLLLLRIFGWSQQQQCAICESPFSADDNECRSSH